ncbi:glycosyltransferase [Mesorhizobium sp. BR-1-1-10]|uniref:glycosyltransferase n=1 Tax=Mesorhizobium sp. BR-1-1-10 TaxID=2876660 RepID=UPI001CD090C8|nr:glycosyltransferase [Mesorhizobium sp. BR-1-1-10]MBZ9977933.1 glycosyltransferase [Mesorhizobium sp. BR-1-1-10]
MTYDVCYIGIYPISKPYHGGQRRVRALVDALIDSGIRVDYIPIFSGVSYPEYDEKEREFAFGRDLHTALFSDGRKLDLHAYSIFDAEPSYKNSLLARINRCSPKVIIFEQPWHSALLSDLRESGLEDVKIVYSSQNVESQLMPSLHDRKAAEKLERDLVEAADLVLACTRRDADIYVKWGARKVCVFGNGHIRRHASESLLRSWRHELRYQKIAIFTGSAHPPNAEGFFRMFLPAPGCIPPEAKLVVVGGVCDLITSSPLYSTNRAIFAETTLLIGRQEEDALNALFGLAEVVVLPVTSGGGSNLKTAEALLSLKPVVGTSKSFSGFEDYATLPGVNISDDPAEFKQHIRDILLFGANSERDFNDVRNLTWDTILRAYPSTIKSLVSG